MRSERGRWTTLQARMPAGAGFDLAGLNQAALRRQIVARMRARGLHSAEEYVRLLQSSSGEYAALSSALQATLRRAAWGGQGSRRRLRSQFRRWVQTLPLPAVVAEGLLATHSLRLVACNRPARQLFGQPEGLLKASSQHCQWLNPDQTPCGDQDLPLYQAIWRGRATSGRPFLLRGDDGQLSAVVVNACRLPGQRPRAIETIEAAVAPAALAGSSVGSAARYERSFEEAPEPLILTDPAGLLLEANARARQLLGTDQGGGEGRSLASFLTDGALRAFHEMLAALAHSGQAQARLSVQAQPELVLEAEARQVGAEEDRVVEWMLHDVTGHVATERLRGDLFDLVLHDLRSPLATSILGLEASERGLERQDAVRAKRSLSMVATALRRLSRMVDSLLDASRLEAGQTILRLAEVEPAGLLSAVASEVEPAVATHKLQLELKVPANLPTIVADGDMVFRAVINLLDNAIKFSPPGGKVRVEAAAQDHGLLIAVTDEGPGVPLKLQSRIFDKFVRPHVPQAARGYGLGLSFCKLAAEAHGGWVAVDSTPGEGSTFALWFPAEPDSPAAA